MNKKQQNNSEMSLVDLFRDIIQASQQETEMKKYFKKCHRHTYAKRRVDKDSKKFYN